MRRENINFRTSMRSSKSLYVIGLLVPLYSLSVRFFVEWSWFKILPLVFLGAIVLKRSVIYRPKRDIFNVAVLLIFYMFVITFFSYIDNYTNGRFLYAIAHGQEPARTYGHMIIQFFVVVGLVVNFFLLTFLVKTQREVGLFINGFLVGNFVSVVFGCIQFVSGTGKYHVHGRMNGLGGEPRHFAAFLSLALIIILANYLSKNPLRIRGTRLMVPVFLMGLFLSFSTSAWLGFTVAIVALLILSKRMKRAHKICAVIIILIFPVLLASETVQAALQLRLFERMKSLDYFLYFAPKDALVIKLLAEEWWILLFGAGAGGTDSYVIAPGFIGSVSETILKAGVMQQILHGNISVSPSPSSFAIKYIGEYGLVGVLVLLFFIKKILRKVANTPYARIITYISIAVLVASIPISIYMIYSYFIILAVFYAFAYHHTRTGGMTTGYRSSHSQNFV